MSKSFLDFASSTGATENGTRCKGMVVRSPVMPHRPLKVMRENKIEAWRDIL